MSESFAELLEQSINQTQLRPGALLTATIVEIRSDVVIVNAGLKSEGVIDLNEFRIDGEYTVAIGDRAAVVVNGRDGERCGGRVHRASADATPLAALCLQRGGNRDNSNRQDGKECSG